jgi:DNA invertase Pin-like site-specific DNA recombinase
MEIHKITCLSVLNYKQSSCSRVFQKQHFVLQFHFEQNVFVEVVSGINEIKNRPIFQSSMRQKLKDLVMIARINRSSQNNFEFLKLQDILKKKILLLLFSIY